MKSSLSTYSRSARIANIPKREGKGRKGRRERGRERERERERERRREGENTT